MRGDLTRINPIDRSLFACEAASADTGELNNVVATSNSDEQSQEKVEANVKHFQESVFNL